MGIKKRLYLQQFILPKTGSKTERFSLNEVLYNHRVKKRFKILERFLKVVIPLFGETYMDNSSLFPEKAGSVQLMLNG